MPDDRPTWQRVTWAAGDPTFQREAWAKDACAFAKVRNRPSVIALVAALERYLNRDDCWAWASNEVLRGAMGQKHVSAVARALDVAEKELGLIVRETTPVMGEGGRIKTMRRRIFPTRPIGMAEALARRRARPADRRTSHFDSDDRVASEPPGATRATAFYGRDRGGDRLPNLRSPSSEPSSERLGQDTGPLYPSRRNEEIERRSHYGEAATAFLSRSIPLADFVEGVSAMECFASTGEVVADLLDHGRVLYRLVRTGRIVATDAPLGVDSLRDAALRSFTEHRSELSDMFFHLDTLIQGRRSAAA